MLHCEFIYGYDDDILWLRDQHSLKSLTNDMEWALNDIIGREGLSIILGKKVIYQDSDGSWDEVLPRITNGKVWGVNFNVLHAQTKDDAIHMVFNKE